MNPAGANDRVVDDCPANAPETVVDPRPTSLPPWSAATNGLERVSSRLLDFLFRGGSPVRLRFGNYLAM